MPIYTYECESCGKRFEVKQGFQTAPLTVCLTCEGKLHRIIQPVGIVFKGSGFYITDSRGKQNLATCGTKKGEDKSSEGGDDATASTKTETPAKPAANTSSTVSHLPVAA